MRNLKRIYNLNSLVVVALLINNGLGIKDLVSVGTKVLNAYMQHDTQGQFELCTNKWLPYYQIMPQQIF